MLAIQTGNKLEVSMHLSKFKERGVVAFDKVLAIRSEERIPALASNEQTRYQLLVALTASIKSAFNNLNLPNGMNEDQIIDLADAIIDESQQDNLSIEDVLLFLHKLVIGESGKLFNKMDSPTFFEHFEKYRQERHQEVLRIREEHAVNYKVMGGGGLRTKEIDKGSIDASTFFELMETVYLNPENES